MNHHLGYMILGALMSIAGFIPFVWVSRRRFYRRNVAGVEEFRSYGGSVFSRLLERIAKVLGGVLILVGIIVFVVHM